MFRALGIAASGMSAQRTRIEVAASYLANADVTRGADGTAYKRRIVQLRTATPDDQAGSFRFPDQLPSPANRSARRSSACQPARPARTSAPRPIPPTG